MGTSLRPRRTQDTVRIDGIAVADGALWVFHSPETRGLSSTPPNRPPAAGRPAATGVLSRFDLASSRFVARTPIEDPGIDSAGSPACGTGRAVGTAGSAVWVALWLHVFRVDPKTNAIAQEIAVTCPAAMHSTPRPFRPGRFGVWLACGSEPRRKGSSNELRGALRRVDTDSAAVVADILLPSTPGEMYEDMDRVWATEDVYGRKQCWLNEIDLGASRVVRSVLLGSFECRKVVVAGGEAWMLRGPIRRGVIVKVDIATGTIRATIRLPEDRYATDVAVAGDTVWVSMAPRWQSPPMTGDFGSTGVLVTIDRPTGRTRRIIPTGVTTRLAAVDGDTAWLYDSSGAIVRVRDRGRP